MPRIHIKKWNIFLKPLIRDLIWNLFLVSGVGAFKSSWTRVSVGDEALSKFPRVPLSMRGVKSCRGLVRSSSNCHRRAEHSCWSWMMVYLRWIDSSNIVSTWAERLLQQICREHRVACVFKLLFQLLHLPFQTPWILDIHYLTWSPMLTNMSKRR